MHAFELFQTGPFKCGSLPKPCLRRSKVMFIYGVMSWWSEEKWLNYKPTHSFTIIFFNGTVPSKQFNSIWMGRTHDVCTFEDLQTKLIKLDLMQFLAVYFAPQYFLRVVKVSQREMNENPRKRLRVPPNSATRDEIGKISSSVATLAQRENKNWSNFKADG